LFSGNTGC